MVNFFFFFSYLLQTLRESNSMEGYSSSGGNNINHCDNSSKTKFAWNHSSFYIKMQLCRKVGAVCQRWPNYNVSKVNIDILMTPRNFPTTLIQLEIKIPLVLLNDKLSNSFIGPRLLYLYLLEKSPARETSVSFNFVCTEWFILLCKYSRRRSFFFF